MWLACIVDPSGKCTTLLDSPVIGKFSSGQTKLEVAPESKIMVDSVRGVTLSFMRVRSHVLIVAGAGCGTFVVQLLLMLMWCACSTQSSSSSISVSGAQ